MKPEDIRVCVLRVGGTNCDAETQRAFTDLGAAAEAVHLNDVARKNNLLDYHVLVFPGGFSYGDYVRAGAILAKSVVARLGHGLKEFVSEERPILGICNGFQILVEAGLLPGFNGLTELPQAALATNVPIGYRCVWVHLKHEGKGKCIFTKRLKKGQVIHVPIAHGEGRFMFERSKQNEKLSELIENDQLVFQYCTEDGGTAQGRFPINPNGSFHDIAGICDRTGTIFGLMPHPERAYYTWQQPERPRNDKTSNYADGRLVFESVVDYLVKKL